MRILRGLKGGILFRVWIARLTHSASSTLLGRLLAQDQPLIARVSSSPQRVNPGLSRSSPPPTRNYRTCVGGQYFCQRRCRASKKATTKPLDDISRSGQSPQQAITGCRHSVTLSTHRQCTREHKTRQLHSPLTYESASCDPPLRSTCSVWSTISGSI